MTAKTDIMDNLLEDLMDIAKGVKDNQDPLPDASISNYCKIANIMTLVNDSKSRTLSVGDPTKGGGMKSTGRRGK